VTNQLTINLPPADTLFTLPATQTETLQSLRRQRDELIAQIAGAEWLTTPCLVIDHRTEEYFDRRQVGERLERIANRQGDWRHDSIVLDRAASVLFDEIDYDRINRALQSLFAIAERIHRRECQEFEQRRAA
jgi:hypothetical protein